MVYIYLFILYLTTAMYLLHLRSEIAAVLRCIIVLDDSIDFMITRFVSCRYSCRKVISTIVDSISKVHCTLFSGFLCGHPSTSSESTWHKPFSIATVSIPCIHSLLLRSLEMTILSLFHVSKPKSVCYCSAYCQDFVQCAVCHCEY